MMHKNLKLATITEHAFSYFSAFRVMLSIIFPALSYIISWTDDLRPFQHQQAMHFGILNRGK